jgi:predicted RNA-binding Zn ribbon-like protein
MFNLADFIGGDASLDFVNTVGGTRAGVSNDMLQTHDDLLEWAVLARLIDPRLRARLAQRAKADPRKAEKILLRAKDLREAIHGVFSAIAHSRAAPRADLARLNDEWVLALTHARIREIQGRFAWDWEDAASLDRPLWPIARAAADLLVSCPLERLHECASETCGWLFLDTSKNGSRRWCDMRGCGNRAKVRRYRASC